MTGMDEGNRWIMWLMFFTVVGLAFFLPLVDNDFGWHYVCGNRILSGARWCLENDLTYLLPSYKWAYTAFIYDALIAWGYNLGGFLFLSFMGSGLVVLLTYLAVKHVRGPDWWRMGIVAFTLLLSKLTLFSLGLRSQWMSLLGLVWLLAELMRKKPRWRWVLLATWLWANSHSGFFLAPLCVGVYVGGEILAGWRKDSGQARMTKKAGLVWLGMVGVTLLNPFGFDVYAELWRHFKMPLNTLVAEWVSPIGWQYWSVWLLGLTGVGWLLMMRERKMDKLWFRVGMMVVLTWLALSARRNLVPFYFGWLILVGGEWGGKILKQVQRSFGFAQDDQTVSLIMMTVILPVLLIYFGIKASRTVRIDTDWGEYCTKGYVNLPCGAIEYLRGKRGMVYNTYEWGGFLIWQLPEMKMFVDGRMPAWIGEGSKSPYTTWLEVIQAQPGWNEYLLGMGTEYLLIAPGTFLDLELDEGEALEWGWEEEYRDKGAVVYGRM